jgi:hypothetical protein
MESNLRGNLILWEPLRWNEINSPMRFDNLRY